jgi:glucose dehydrogenase
MRVLIVSVIVVGVFVAHAVRAQNQTGARNPAADWPTYNRDLAGTRYSRLTQINTKNVTTLVQA